MDTQNNNHNHQPPFTAIDFRHNHHQHFPILHMFEKPLTPSDVGKLNRLVIPKQHAEKHFPVADQQKGLVLSFEDESGKLWRFRYSYWNSSQSYVFTKGWSRYVKDKRLDAGDVVLFQRHVLDCDRMFIGWRRRAIVAAQPVASGGDGQFSYHSQHLNLALPYQPDCLHAGEMYENVDTYQSGVVGTRRLRLFGVNLECPEDLELSTLNGPSEQSDHHYNLSSSNSLHHMILSDECQATSNFQVLDLSGNACCTNLYILMGIVNL